MGGWVSARTSGQVNKEGSGQIRGTILYNMLFCMSKRNTK